MVFKITITENNQTKIIVLFINCSTSRSNNGYLGHLKVLLYYNINYVVSFIF